jgi:hypothetical protein
MSSPNTICVIGADRIVESFGPHNRMAAHPPPSNTTRDLDGLGRRHDYGLEVDTTVNTQPLFTGCNVEGL